MSCSRKIKVPVLTDEEYTALRMELMRVGLTLRRFALREGFSVQTTYDAARGRRAGKQARAIQNRLRKVVYAGSK